ncbi:MAG: hypothetical protein AB7R99_25495 [Pseudonocardia sp.]
MSAAPAARVTPNLLGIATGIAASAGTWAAAHHLGAAPSWPATALYLPAGLAWATLAVAWARPVLRRRRGLAAELGDPGRAPYLCLLPIGATSVAAGLGLAGPAAVCAMLTVLVGALVLARPGGRPRLRDLHPGHLLPAVVGPLFAATTLAHAGFPGPARIGLGAGLACWVVLGPLVVLRSTRHPLPPALMPARALEIAPPVLAGSAHLALTGGRIDAFGAVLLVAVLAALAQQCLLARRYRRAGFGPASWAFAFPYAATAGYLLHWVVLLPAFAAGAATATLLAAVTALLGLLAVRTALALRGGTFPAAAAPQRPRTARTCGGSAVLVGPGHPDPTGSTRIGPAVAPSSRDRAGSAPCRTVRPGGRPAWRRSWASSRRSARRCPTARPACWRPRADGGRPAPAAC